MFAQLVQAFSQMTEGRFSMRPLTLTPGQIVMGEVVNQLNEQEVVVRIADRMVRARTDIPLTHHKHWFQVQPEPHQLVLKVVTAGQLSQDGHPSQQGIPPTAQALLKNWGLQTSKQHVRALEWLMQQQLPLTRQSVEQLAIVWRELGQTSRVEQATALALSKRLPLTTPVVTAVHQFLSGSPLTHQVTQLAEQLQTWLAKTKTVSPQLRNVVDAFLKQAKNVSHYRHGMQEVFQQRALTTNQVITNSRHTAEKVADQPARMTLSPYSPSRFSTAAQSSQPSPMSTQPSPAPQPLVQPPSVHPPKVQEQQLTGPRTNVPLSFNSANEAETLPLSAKGLTRETSFATTAVQKWLQLLGIRREGQLTHLLRTAMTNTVVHPANDQAVNLKESIMRLLQFSLPANVRETAEAVVQHVTGQQLLLTTTSETNWQHLLFHIPFSMTEDREAAIHVFTRKKSDGQLDKDNCRLLLQLDLERLGWSCLLVQIVNRVVHIDWYCDDAHLTHQLATDEAKLREQLQAVGYDLSGVVVKPLSQHEHDLDRNKWPITGGVSSKGVDVRI